MRYVIATNEDINSILELQEKNLVSNLKDDEKNDGFVTTPFTINQLKELITLEGIFLCKIENETLAYVMCASWNYWIAWPMFEYMHSFLHTLEYKGIKLNKTNSYQYGPICVKKEYRGKDIFSNLYEFARVEMNKRYPILITFINKINKRSYEAHVRKLNLEVLCDFKFNDNDFYLLAYDTSLKVK